MIPFKVGCIEPVGILNGWIKNVRTPMATIAATRDADCFNWGYDPRHYGARVELELANGERRSAAQASRSLSLRNPSAVTRSG